MRKNKRIFLNIKDNEKRNMVKKLIHEDSSEIRELIERLGRIIEDFHVTSLNTNLLEDNYVKPMLNREFINGDVDPNLNIKEFTQLLNDKHAQIITDIKAHRQDHMFDESEPSWHTEVNHELIPFQLIISGKYKDGKEEKCALIIYVGCHNIENNEVANAVLTKKDEFTVKIGNRFISINV